MKLGRSVWCGLISTALLTGLAGCAYGFGTATPTAIENNAVALVPGNAESHTPFIAQGPALRTYLGSGVRKTVGSGTYFIEVVSLKNLPGAPDVFLENSHAVVISRLRFFKSFSAMTANDIRGYTSDPRSLSVLEGLKNDTAYARIIEDVIGLRVETRPVSSLPKELRKGLPAGGDVTVVDFLTVPSSPQGAKNYFPLAVSSVVLKPGTTTPLASYSAPLPVPPGVN